MRRRARNQGGETEKPPIVTVLEAYFDVAISDPGSGHVKISCVFHPDDNPSASVNVDTSYYHCFSCQWAGDSFDLIMHVEDCDFNGAKKVAQERFGYDGPTSSGKPQPAAKRVSILDRGKTSSGNQPTEGNRRRRPRLR